MINIRKMKQEFKLMEDGKVQWTYEKDVEDFKDKEFGNVGKSHTKGEIIFDSKEIALSVLDRDLGEVEAFIKQYEEEVEKNKHNLDKFSQLKELIEAIGKLHNDFKEVSSDKIYSLYNSDPKKYTKLLKEFNTAKDYIKEELNMINKEYQKYLNYKTAKPSLEFNQEQYKKIKEQRDILVKL